MTDEPPAHLIDWKGRDWTPDVRRAVQPPQQPLHRAGRAVPDDRRQLGGPGRRADRRHPVRRPARHERAAGQRALGTGSTACSSARRSPPRRPPRPRAPSAQLRRDPFAMLPFCGYNMADYWGHWLKIGKATSPDKLPRIFQVNWFRKDADGKFLWPGFGENSRVLAWIIDRVNGVGDGDRDPDRDRAGAWFAVPGRPGRHRRAARGAVRGGPGQLAGRVRPDRGVLRQVRRGHPGRAARAAGTACAHGWRLPRP